MIPDAGLVIYYETVYQYCIQTGLPTFLNIIFPQPYYLFLQRVKQLDLFGPERFIRGLKD